MENLSHLEGRAHPGFCGSAPRRSELGAAAARPLSRDLCHPQYGAPHGIGAFGVFVRKPDYGSVRLCFELRERGLSRCCVQLVELRRDQDGFDGWARDTRRRANELEQISVVIFQITAAIDENDDADEIRPAEQII